MTFRRRWVPAGEPQPHAFARLRFRASLPLLLVYLGTRMVPPIMLVVAMFLIARSLGLVDAPVALIVTYCVFTMPFSIWPLQAYFRTPPVVTANFVDTASIQFDYVMTAGVLTALPPFVGGPASGTVKG